MANKLQERDNMWFEGPKFLKGRREDWPQQTREKKHTEEALQEVRKEAVFALTAVQGITDTYDGARDDLERVIKEVSSWGKLVRIVAWCRRAARRKEGSALGKQELQEAEENIIKLMQKACFARTRQALQQQQRLTHNAPIVRLAPFFDQKGLLRASSRLQDAQQLEFEVKFQIVVPKDHPLTPLFILAMHKKLLHAGPQRVLAELMQTHWILQGTNIIRKTVRGCIDCRKRKAKPSQQVMAPLPSFRFPGKRVDPFAATAVDAAGPYKIKEGNKGYKKGYFVLFTCMAYRAVHLEPIFTMTTASFLQALDRFTSRRGVPELIISDNGMNFMGAAKELQQLWTKEAKQRYREERPELEWKFLPPYAPHFGGAHERLIAAVKAAMFHAFKPTWMVGMETFLTALAVVEGILNSRPLTYITSNEDMPVPLTPADFLNTRPYRVIAELPEGAARQSIWRKLQDRLDHFWKRFEKEVRPHLQVMTKWRLKQRNLRPGDVVVFLEGGNRGVWPLGRIHAVEESKDGVVRKVKVMANGNIYQRAIERVMLLLPHEEEKELQI